MGMRHSRAYIKADGALLETLPGAKLDLGGVERTAVEGDHAVLGYTEKTKASVLTCEISLGQGISLAQLQKITGATVTYEADTGQTYVQRNAFVTKTLSVSSGDGKVALEFAGDPAEEMGV